MNTYTSIMQNRTSMGVKINGWRNNSFGKLNKKQARKGRKALVARRDLNRVPNHKKNANRKVKQKQKDNLTSASMHGRTSHHWWGNQPSGNRG